MSSPSVGETAYRVEASETHASPGSSPEKNYAYRSPSPCVPRTEEATPTRSISPSWSPSIGRMVDSRRNSPAVPSSPLVDAEKQRVIACDDQRVPVATIANEVNAEAPLVSLTKAKEALDGDDLKQKYAVLRGLQDQLVIRGSLEEHEAGDVAPFMESMTAVCQALKRPGLGALRMVELMCSIASTLACLTGPGFTYPASKIVPELLQFLKIPETGLRKTVSQSVETILEECPATSTLHAATASLFEAKNPYLRRKGSRFLCFILDKWPEETLRVSRSLIMDQIRKAMVDSDANVRRECRSTFGAFVRLWPAEGGRIYNNLDSASQRATLQEQPFVSNFVGGETFPSCEEGNPMESCSLTPKTWKSPGSVGPSPASFGRTHPGGIRKFSSPPKGAIRRASRLPSLRTSSKGSRDAGKFEDNSMGAAEVTISPSRSLSSEESELEIDHVTVRAITEENAVAIDKVEGGQHAKKIPCMLLVRLMTFITVVVFGAFGIVFVSMEKLPGGVSHAMYEDAGVVVRTTDVLSQKKLEVSVISLDVCTAAIDVGCITSKDDDDGTSGSEINEEYDSAFSEGLTPGSKQDRALAAVGDVYDGPLVDDRGETETSNQHSSEGVHHMVEDSDAISATPGRTDPEVPISRSASDDSRLARDVDAISANLDRVNPGESMSLVCLDEERMVNDTSKSSFSAGLVKSGEPSSRPATEDGHPVGDTDTVSLPPGLEDLGEFLSRLALEKLNKDMCLVVSAIAFGLVVIWIAGVKSRLLGDGTLIDPNGVEGDENMSTPPRRNAREEFQQEEEELGCYNKIEVIKDGNSPGSVRSVKRSRRIESAKISRRKKDEIG